MQLKFDQAIFSAFALLRFAAAAPYGEGYELSLEDRSTGNTTSPCTTTCTPPIQKCCTSNCKNCCDPARYCGFPNTCGGFYDTVSLFFGTYTATPTPFSNSD